ncbi:MAG: type II toxin-antitoxin system HipA family toxin [Acidobacteriota bacterium]
MYRPVRAIEVRVWGTTVGAAALDPGLGAYAFEYDPAFVRSGIELAPLTMPLSAAREPFVFPQLPERTFRRLPALLADALPDDFGNALVDAWMAREGVARESITPLDRLAYMNRRGMGALEFRPARGGTRPSSTAIELSTLVEGARLAVAGEVGTDELASAALAQIIRVGTSAGGARAKAVIAWNPETEEIRAGQFEVPDGFEHWLLKFDGMGTDRELGEGRGYGRIEYAYHLMAVAAGIAMAPCRLLEEGGRAHFMTRRFDRDGNAKHHVQTLCAMAHMDFRQVATHDAAQFLKTLRALRLGYDALEEALRRVAFNVMAANCDDHTKNISFLLREGGDWELAPAYDVTHAFNPEGEWTYQHLLAVNGKFSGIAREGLLELAERFAVGTAPAVLDRVREAVARWPEFAGKAGLEAAQIERIAAHHALL